MLLPVPMLVLVLVQQLVGEDALAFANLMQPSVTLKRVRALVPAVKAAKSLNHYQVEILVVAVEVVEHSNDSSYYYCNVY